MEKGSKLLLCSEGKVLSETHLQQCVAEEEEALANSEQLGFAVLPRHTSGQKKANWRLLQSIGGIKFTQEASSHIHECLESAGWYHLGKFLSWFRGQV